MTRLVFDPWIPWALWLPLALAAAALWCAYVVVSRRRLVGPRRSPILAMMAIAVVIPLLMLLNPVWVRELPPPAGKPLLTLLVDRSLSMATSDGAQNQPRLTVARRLAEAIDKDLQTRFDVEIKSFSETPAPTSTAALRDLTASGDLTDVASAVTSSLADRPRGQVVWVLSDGIHNAGGGAGRLRQAAEQARSMAVPIYATTIGGPAGARDLEVSLPMPQEMAFVGQQVLVHVTVNQRGQISDRAQVRLLLDGEVVDERQVGLTRDTATETTFRVQQPKTGLFRYEVVVAGVPGEVTELNNRTSLVLRVIDEPVRVLLLEGKPYWDTKFLVRTLALDPSIELHSVVRMTADRYMVRKMTRPETKSGDAGAAAGGADPKVPDAAKADETKADAGTAPPTVKQADDAQRPIGVREDAWEIARGEQHWLDDPQQLAKFQVVILGRNAEAFVTDEALVQLKKWLRQGDGSLVCFRGPPTSQIGDRLGELLPVRWSQQNESRFQVQFTTTGQALRWFSLTESDNALSQLPSLARTALPERPKPLAVVLASAAAGSASADGQPTPAITFQPYGGGRVVVVEGAGMWRWAILPPGEQDHDQLYGELWRSMMRWLVANVGLLPTQRVSLRSDKTSFSGLESATATLLVRDARDFGQTPQIRLQSANGEPVLVRAIPSGEDLHQFRLDFGKLPEGRYTARVEGARSDEVAAGTAFDVVDNLRERLDVAARPDLMQLLAEGSGGTVIAGQEAADLLAGFDKHQASTMPRRLQQTVAWDRWWVLTGLLMLWGMTWAIRRRGGLV